MADDTGDKSWLRTPLTDPVEVAQRYDDWVPTYDNELASWGYDAPLRAAVTMAARVPSGTSILDIGCGTGLTGRELASLGLGPIDGVDLSERSLEAARTRNVYRSLRQHDFNASPLPFADASYGAAQCVGVLSYAHDPAALIREMCRVVQSDGTVLFSHRTDLWETQDLPGLLDRFCRTKVLSACEWSEPLPYMPGNADFGTDVLVRYTTATVA